MFAIIKFENGNTYAVVPITWLSNGECPWPDKKEDLERIQFNTPVQPAWKKYDCKVIECLGKYIKIL